MQEKSWPLPVPEKSTFWKRRRQIQEAPSVAEGLARFFNEFVPERVAIGRMSERTAQEYGKQAQCYVGPALSNLWVAGVSRRDVERMVKPMPNARHATVYLPSPHDCFRSLKHGNGEHRTLIR